MTVWLLLLIQVTPIFTVQRIEVRGLKWYHAEGVLARFGVREGQTYRMEDIRNGLRRLYKSWLFDDLSVEVEFHNNQANVILTVTENPRVNRVIFDGNEKVKTKFLQDTLMIRRGTPLSKRSLFYWTRTIEGVYQEKGFLKVQVRPEIAPPDSLGYADLTFHIQEGSSYIIRNIEIVGNQHYPDEALEVLMKNREKRWYRKARFLPDAWPDDLDKILDFYREHGFPNATIDSTRLDYREDGLYITVYLTEGKRYWFGRTEFEGNEVFSDSLLRAYVDLQRDRPPLVERLKAVLGKSYYTPGVYRKSRIDEAVATIAGLYGDSGYIYVNIQPEERLVSDSVIDVVFHIQEGIRVKVRKIEIVGNTKTYESVIRREIDLVPGKYFSRTLAIKSQRDLYFLNYFESVNLDFVPTEDSGYIDLVFRVKEKPTGQMGLGGSYSATYGPSLYVQLQNPNFLGRGQRLNLLLEYGSKRRNFQFGFTEPYLFGQRHSLGAEIYDVSTYLTDYTTRRQGGALTYSRRLWNDYWQLTTTYRLERIELYDLAEGLSNLPEFRFWQERSPLWTSAVTTRILYDSRNRIFNATEGRRVGLTVELAGGPLWGTVHYLKPEFEVAQYWPLEKWITVVSLKGGYIGGLYQREDVPFYERFYLGDIGPYGLRGYPFRSVGPRRNGQNIGGRVYGIFTVEERYRVSEQMYVLAFVDIGDAWEHSGMINLWNTKKGVGIGIRMEVPMVGVIGLDLAYGLARKQWMPHIQFGTSF